MLEVHVSNHTMLIDRAYGIIVHLAFVSYMVMLDMLISGTPSSERRGSIEASVPPESEQAAGWKL